jgi:aquaporin Z
VNPRNALAEFLGTFLFMAIGYLSVVGAGIAGLPTGLVVPFSFGLGLLAAIFAFGQISGGHYNPAVTVAMVVDGRTTPANAVGYIVAQILGALAAGYLVVFLFDQAAAAAGITAPGQGVSDLDALVIESIMTAGFVFVILASTRHASALAALAIPLTLVAIHFSIATLTGSSVNPARSIGSAVAGGNLTSLWIYLVAPTIGGLVAAMLYRLVSGGEQVDTGTAPREAAGSDRDN